MFAKLTVLGFRPLELVDINQVSEDLPPGSPGVPGGRKTGWISCWSFTHLTKTVKRHIWRSGRLNTHKLAAKLSKDSLLVGKACMVEEWSARKGQLAACLGFLKGVIGRWSHAEWVQPGAPGAELGRY